MEIFRISKMMLVMIIKRMMNKMRELTREQATVWCGYMHARVCVCVCEYAKVCLQLSDMHLFFKHASAVSEGRTICGVSRFHHSLLRVG